MPRTNDNIVHVSGVWVEDLVFRLLLSALDLNAEDPLPDRYSAAVVLRPGEPFPESGNKPVVVVVERVGLRPTDPGHTINPGSMDEQTAEIRVVVATSIEAHRNEENDELPESKIDVDRWQTPSAVAGDVARVLSGLTVHDAASGHTLTTHRATRQPATGEADLYEVSSLVTVMAKVSRGAGNVQGVE